MTSETEQQVKTVSYEYSDETKKAMSEPILTADEEKVLARRIELAQVLEKFPSGTAAEITLAILLQLSNDENTARRIAESVLDDIPHSLYGLSTSRAFRNLIDGVIDDETCGKKDPDFDRLTSFSANSALITPSSWEMINEIAPDATAEEVRRTLQTPEALIDALSPLIPTIAKLHRTIQREAEQAREKMFRRNTRLVRQLSNRYHHPGMGIDDRFQEGCIGLITSIERFNHHKGYKFSTYATWWVRQAITRALADQARTIRIPVHMVEKLSALSRKTEELERDGHRATHEEIAEAMDLDVKDILWMKSLNRQTPASLDEPLNTNETTDSTMAEFIPDRNPSTEEKAVARRFNEQIEQTISNTVTPREKLILEMRFGLNGKEPMTLEQVGRHMNLTRERIRQIQDRAMKKLKPALTKTGIAEFAG